MKNKINEILKELECIRGMFIFVLHGTPDLVPSVDEKNFEGFDITNENNEMFVCDTIDNEEVHSIPFEMK